MTTNAYRKRQAELDEQEQRIGDYIVAAGFLISLFAIILLLVKL
jgi:hypothetical protein